MTAEDLIRQLRGTWCGIYGTAPCPVCQIECRRDQKALTVTNGSDRLLAHCKRSGCSFQDIVAAAGISSGDWERPDPLIDAQRQIEKELSARKKAAQAKICWDETIPIIGTFADVYLRSRSITCELPCSLRFHASCWHNANASRHPVMVAAITSLGGSRVPAIHRTYLSSNGVGKANVSPAKAMLGRASGGCIHLSNGAGALVVTEGIETGLSLLCGLMDGAAHVVAALSTSGVQNLILPAIASELILAPDGDEAGRNAARLLGERAQSSGWNVNIMEPPNGMDWNDVLRMKGAANG